VTRPAAALIVILAACLRVTADDPVPVVTFGTTVVLPSGLRGLVYHIRHNSTRLPEFEKLKPVGTIYTASLNIPPQDFRAGFPGVTKRFEWFAIDYTGRFWIATPGSYTFVLTSDDGAKLFIDDGLVVDNDGLHGPEDKTGSIDLSGGIHRIRVSYFQGPRLQVALVLRVQGPGEPLRVFSTDEFKPPEHPEVWLDPAVGPR
jgi:hypothetical protein